MNKKAKNADQLWEKFLKSGNISDYIIYKKHTGILKTEEEDTEFAKFIDQVEEKYASEEENNRNSIKR